MDHLPEPHDPLAPTVVPYLGLMYDGNGIEGYPFRQGWDWSPAPNGFSSKLTRPELEISENSKAQLCQAWLFLELLRAVFEVCSIAINFDDFVTFRDNRSALCTKTLPEKLEEWEIAERSATPDMKLAHMRTIATIISSLRPAIKYFSGPSDETGESQHAHNFPVYFSIMILMETLVNAANIIYQNTSGAFIALPSKRWQSILLEQGWCPNDVKKLMGLHHTSALYFASRLPRQTRPHRGCSEFKCEINQVDPISYKQRHVTNFCQCPDIAVNISEVERLLSKDRIPCFIIREEPNHELGLIVEVLDGTDGHFVAISHVWKDGLGCQNGNYLPRCQLRELHRKVKDIQTELPTTDNCIRIWIDSFCVPRRSGPKREALTMMTRIYRHARKVLVLDSELQAVSIHCCVEEHVLRIIFSSWMTRSWTLQEGLLGVVNNNLYVQFKESAFDVSREFRLEEAGKPVYLHNIVSSRAILYLKQFLPLTGERQSQLSFLVTSLRHRQTSNPSDESLCLALLMDLPKPEISNILLSTSADERMRLFWIAFQQVPTLWLFYPGPKLPMDNFHWAPKTFFTPTSGLAQTKFTQTSACDENGLYVNLEGIILSFSDASHPAPSSPYIVRLGLSDVVHFVGPRDDYPPGWENLCNRPGTLALLLSPKENIAQTSEARITGMAGFLDNRVLGNQGVLVSVENRAPETIYARYLHPVTINVGSDDDLEFAKKYSDDEALRGFFIDAEPPKAVQKWCIT